MKKNILKSAFLLAIIGGFSAGCAVEPVPSQPEETPTATYLELCASLPDVQTKTSLGAEPDFKVLWSKGDQISVNGVLSNAVAEEDHNKPEVRFRVGGVSAPYKVLYPGTTQTNVVTLPATQNYVADSFDSEAYAAYGTVVESDGELKATLNNFSGLVRFALNGTATLSKIEVNALGGEKLHGTFTLADSFNGEFTGGTEGTLTYNFGEGLTLSEADTYVYISLPAQAYSAGIEAKVYQADGAFMRLKFWGEGEKLAGNHIRAFASKAYAAGRVEELVGIGDLVAEDGGMPNVPAGVTVAIFNTLRFTDSNRPADAIDHIKQSNASYRPEGAIVTSNSLMREAFGKVIYNTQADIIGFNEINSSMAESGKANSVEDMAKAQGCNYNYIFFSSTTDEYTNGFAYNPNVLKLDNYGYVWYSKFLGYTENKILATDGRTFVWGEFTHKISGKKFWFFVAQLPTSDDPDLNLDASSKLNKFAKDKAGDDAKIVVGDMNNANHANNDCQLGAEELLGYWEDAYEVVDKAGNLAPFYKKYPGTQSGTGNDYHYSLQVFCAKPERRIDKIMTNGACRPTTYKTIRNTYTVRYEGTGYFYTPKKDEEGNTLTDAEGNPLYDWEPNEINEDIACYPSDHLAVVSYITLD